MMFGLTMLLVGQLARILDTQEDSPATIQRVAELSAPVKSVFAVERSGGRNCYTESFPASPHIEVTNGQLITNWEAVYSVCEWKPNELYVVGNECRWRVSWKHLEEQLRTSKNPSVKAANEWGETICSDVERMERERQSATRSAGSNNLYNYGVYNTASGGQVNYSLNVTGNTQLGDATSDALTLNGMGYNGSVAQFRDLEMRDGKLQEVMRAPAKE